MIAVLELLEVQAAVFRRRVVLLAVSLALVLVAAGCALAGLLFAAWALHVWAVSLLGPAGAALAAALFLLFSALVLLWAAKKLSK